MAWVPEIGHSKFHTLAWKVRICKVYGNTLLVSRKAAGNDHSKKDTVGKNTASEENKAVIIAAKDAVTAMAVYDLPLESRYICVRDFDSETTTTVLEQIGCVLPPPAHLTHPSHALPSCCAGNLRTRPS